MDVTFALYRGAWFNLYSSLHFETVWRSQTLTNSEVPISKDTSTLTTSDIFITRSGYVLTKNILQRPNQLPLYKANEFNDHYSGIGLPMKINVKKALEIYINPSFGISSFQYSSNDTLQFGARGTAMPTVVYINSKNRAIKPYFLTKFQISTSVAPVDVVIGGEIRKVYGAKDNELEAFRAFYIGASVSLEKFKR
jgi:hypothetical protein